MYVCNYVRIFIYQVSSGVCRVCWGLYGYIWVCIGMDRYICYEWVCMGIYGYIGVCRGMWVCTILNVTVVYFAVLYSILM